MLIHKMNAGEVVKKYVGAVPSLFETVEKYPDETFVVFEQDNIPKVVFLHRTHNVHGNQMHILTAIAYMVYDLPVTLMRSFRERYGKKADIVAYDLPQQVHIDEISPNVVVYTSSEVPADTFFKGVELDDSDDTIGTRELTEIIQQSPGVSISLGFTSLQRQQYLGRFLAEVHGYQLSRRVFVV